MLRFEKIEITHEKSDVSKNSDSLNISDNDNDIDIDNDNDNDIDNDDDNDIDNIEIAIEDDEDIDEDDESDLYDEFDGNYKSHLKIKRFIIIRICIRRIWKIFSDKRSKKRKFFIRWHLCSS